MPVRKSFFWKAALASLRSVAAFFVTMPASVLICASNLTAASWIAPLERLVGGMSKARQSDEHGEKADAKKREHGVAP